MIDVIAKLKEIAESGYDNEDIQRGIDAAATQNYEVSEEDNKLVSEISVLASEDDVIDEGSRTFGSARKKAEVSRQRAIEKAKRWMKSTGKSAEDAVKEFDLFPSDIRKLKEEAVELDAVEEVHEDVEEDTILADMLKLAGRSGVMGLSQNNIIAESLELDEQEVEEADEVEEDAIDEEAVEETVAVPVQALEELMRLAGYENYEAKIDEYENAPEPEYMDAEEQLIGLSGGLNGPKKAYAASAGGDNAMAQEPREVEETIEESFYSDYSKMVEELKAEDE